MRHNITQIIQARLIFSVGDGVLNVVEQRLTEESLMICPDTDFNCDNPGCRHGGCQGRRPSLPLLRALEMTLPILRPIGEADARLPVSETAPAAGNA